MSDKPILYDRLARKVAVRDAVADVPDVPLTKTLFLAGREPRADMHGLETVTPVYDDRHDERREQVFRLDLELSRVRLGQRSFPPGLKGEPLAARRDLLKEDDHADALTGLLPDHLALRVRPEKLDKALAVPKKIDALAALRKRDAKWATTVFAPDNRYTFSDTAFPWCTAGRVETSSGGWASGVMIGPRHLLTCSHAIGWLDPPDPYVAGWVKFVPSYFDGSEPFGEAWGTYVYWQEKVTPPTISGTEGRNDYVVVVLDRRMGDLTGWMGSRTYDDSWDGGTYWSHIGYPGDLSSGTRPSFQGNFALNGDDNQPGTNQEIFHTADVWPGQSGGPVFGWWDGEPWPRVVADQSWQNTSTNGASGGSNMVDLVIRARNDYP